MLRRGREERHAFEICILKEGTGRGREKQVNSEKPKRGIKKFLNREILWDKTYTHRLQ